MSQTARPATNASLDFFFVLNAAFFVIFVQGMGGPLFLSLAFPVLYLLAAKFLARVDLPSAAGRAYLLCFLAGLVGLAVHLYSLLGLMQMGVGGNSMQQSLPLVLSEAVDAVPYLVGPLILGVTLYTACSVFERTTSARESVQVTPILEKLNEWFANSEIPEELRDYLADMHERVSHVRQECQGMAEAFSAAESNLARLSQTARQANDSLGGVNGSAERLAGTLSQLDDDVTAATAGIDQLRTGVTQIGGIVDEFSEIVSHKILEM